MSSRINNNPDKIFEFWCEVAPNEPNSKSSGRILESFPENFNDIQVLSIIPEFAFPCDHNNFSENISSYSFVLTNIDSKWRYGFCRHDPKSSRAMIIITYLPWHDLFFKFLNVLAILKKSDIKEFRAFLKETYNSKVPEQTESITLQNSAGTFTFKRPSSLPSIPENHNLNLYYNFVEPKLMIEIFAALLNERRIIFTSKNLDVISSCVQAANSFLYPMVWQHIFIPILPLRMKDNLMAPMPFLCGVHESIFENHVRRDEIGDVVILHCDKKVFESPFDDVKTLPSEIVSSLKRQLNSTNDLLGNKLAKIFLNALVRLIGGYRDACKFHNPIVFDDDMFIDSQPTQFRPFVEKMLQLQIFRQFIEERLEMLNKGEGSSDDFEMEIFHYGNRKSSSVNRHIRNVHEKVNPTIKSAVKSVKSSYRGLKTKIRETSSQFKSDVRMSTGHTSMMSTNKRHSAPSSPVFSHRSFYSTDPSHIRLQTNSTLQNNYSTSVLNSYGSQNSPIASSSSSTSSEINLFQELQTQGFFDRTSSKNRHQMLMVNESVNDKNGKRASDISSNSKTFQSPFLLSSLSTSSSKISVEKSFPLNEKNDNNFDAIPSDPPPLPPRSKFISPQLKEPTFRSFVSSYPQTIDRNALNGGDKALLNTSISQIIGNINNNKTESETNDDASDLINFSDSFSISDFDPLNEKAKSETTTQIPTTVTSFENPVYPYFTPSNLPTASSQNHDELELLKHYELDKFSVIQSKICANPTNNNTTKVATFDIFGDNNVEDDSRNINMNSKKWTKFD